MVRVPSDYRPHVKRARKLGWTLSQSRNGHLRLSPPEDRPDATFIVFPASPSDRMGIQRFKEDLRRQGLPTS